MKKRKTILSFTFNNMHMSICLCVCVRRPLRYFCRSLLTIDYIFFTLLPSSLLFIYVCICVCVFDVSLCLLVNYSWWFSEFPCYLSSPLQCYLFDCCHVRVFHSCCSSVYFLYPVNNTYVTKGIIILLLV